MLTVLKRHYPQLAPALEGVTERVRAVEGDHKAGGVVTAARARTMAVALAP